MSCPLCLSSLVEEKAVVPHAGLRRRYRACGICAMIFLDPEYHLPPEAEKGRYDLHRNDLSDPRYVDYLGCFIHPLKPLLKPGMSGLDFGCGVVDGIARLLSQEGLAMSRYDPHYFPSEEALLQTYDLIACCEAAEHFYHPRKEFELFDRMLNPGGYLALQTGIYDSSIDFPAWWYARDPTHVSFYQRQTFAWIASWKGWKVMDQPKNTVIFKKHGNI